MNRHSDSSKSKGRLECPPEIENIADGCLEFEPTMTPEEGKARFREAKLRWRDSPRLGILLSQIGIRSAEPSLPALVAWPRDRI